MVHCCQSKMLTDSRKQIIDYVNVTSTRIQGFSGENCIDHHIACASLPPSQCRAPEPFNQKVVKCD